MQDLTVGCFMAQMKVDVMGQPETKRPKADGHVSGVVMSKSEPKEGQRGVVS